jgi:hypothetical protein
MGTCERSQSWARNNGKIEIKGNTCERSHARTKEERERERKVGNRN